MGNSIACLAARAGGSSKVYDEGVAIAAGRLSPSPSLPRRTSGSWSSCFASLQDVCVNACASATLAGLLSARALNDLPPELLQRVLDHIIASDQLSLPLLQALVSPWLHSLFLEAQKDVDDAWMPVIARAKHLRALDLSASQLLTDAGTGWLPLLASLSELRLSHCSGLSDAGLRHVGALTGLRELHLRGCDLGDNCLAAVGRLSCLTLLDAGEVPGITGCGLAQLSGLQQLVHLSLGWCRLLGDVAADAANTVSHLSSLGGLTHLNLAGTRVSDGQLVAVLPRLTRLQELDLTGSSVSDLGVPCMRALAGCLRVLKLRSCQVGDAAAPCLAALTRLESLDLSCTGLGSAGLRALAPMHGLRQLTLDMCRVGDEGCWAFRQLTSLERLDLSDTDVTDAGVTQLGRCAALTWLSLCNTEVSDAAAASLSHLTRLVVINLDARRVGDASLRALAPLGPSLRELDLYGARITARGVVLLAAAFGRLQRLDLCGGHITDRACAELCKLQQLRQLNVSQNRCLGDAGLRLLAPALGGSVQELNLSYTSVSDASMPLLASMQALQVVVLSATSVTTAGVSRLQRLRPKLTIKATCRKSISCY